jgi:hypothetical protein
VLTKKGLFKIIDDLALDREAVRPAGRYNTRMFPDGKIRNIAVTASKEVLS